MRLLGAFTVESGKLRVTDPCYDKGVWCCGVLENAKPGIWIALFRMEEDALWGSRVAELCVRHVEHLNAVIDTLADITVGVDSGQAGFFDDAHYPLGETGECGDKNSFYGKVCALTASDNGPGGGVLPFGAVTSSGYGDGGYECHIAVVDDKVVGASITFIGDDDDEDDDPYGDTEDTSDDETTEDA